MERHGAKIIIGYKVHKKNHYLGEESGYKDLRFDYT